MRACTCVRVRRKLKTFFDSHLFYIFVEYIYTYMHKKVSCFFHTGTHFCFLITFILERDYQIIERTPCGKGINQFFIFVGGHWKKSQYPMCSSVRSLLCVELKNKITILFARGWVGIYIDSSAVAFLSFFHFTFFAVPVARAHEDLCPYTKWYLGPSENPSNVSCWSGLIPTPPQVVIVSSLPSFWQD